MVISAAARAAIKAARIIKAKKAVKPRVKKAVKPIVKKRVKPSVRNKDGSITKYHKDGSVSITGPRWVKPKPASDSMSDSDLKRNLVGTSKDGLYYTGLETSKIHPKKLKDMAGRYDTLAGYLRKDKKEYLGVPPPKGNLQDKELFRVAPKYRSIFPFAKPRVISSAEARMKNQGPKRPGAWFQEDPIVYTKRPSFIKFLKDESSPEDMPIIASVATIFTPILGIHTTRSQGKTLTGKDLPKPKDKKPGRR